MKFILLTILLITAPALAIDQQGYLDCKEDAFKALVARYKQQFKTETNVNATTVVTKYDSDYERAGKTACEKKYVTGPPEDRDQTAYQKCLDGALNAGVKRLGENLGTDLGITNNADALERMQTYQQDYVKGDEACRAKFLGEGDSCVQQSKAAVDACSTAKSTAITACDPTQDAGLLSVQRSADSISSSSGAGGVQNSCQSANQQATNANNALANYKTSCTNAKQTCTNQCAQARQAMADCSKSTSGANAESSGDYQSTATNGDTCNTLEVKVQQAEQAVQTYTTTKNDATTCKNETNGVAGGGPGSGDGSASAASSAAGANELAKANSFDAGAAGYADSAGIQSGGGVQTGTTTGASLNLGGGGGMNGLPNFNVDTGAASSVGGKQGNGVNFGSGGGYGGPMAPAPGANKADAIPNGLAVYSGVGGGGGSGGAYGTRGIASEREADSAHRRKGNPGGNNGPDLRAFLPGGIHDPKRGMGGLGGGPDGITGPNSNIWQKVQNRYRVMSVTLLP